MLSKIRSVNPLYKLACKTASGNVAANFRLIGSVSRFNFGQSNIQKQHNEARDSKQLLPSDHLVPRHLGPNEAEKKEMLALIGVNTEEELVKQTVPSSILLSEADSLRYNDYEIEDSKTESEVLQYMKEIAKKNKLYKSYIGCGYYPTLVPTVILRNVLENPLWYTSYTPYQAEVSQGRLEALINFQTMISELTKLPFANASLLDEATAAGEALYMSYNISNGEKKEFFVSKHTFPQTIEVIKTKAYGIGVKVIVDDPETYNFKSNQNICGVLVQNPDNLGRLHDYTKLGEITHANNATFTIAVDILSTVLVKPPGEMGADIALGSSQRFGVPMGYGGPHAAFFATKDEHKRKMPGRIIGISRDVHGNQAYRMSMQTREQHIKRDKATSNICTAQALLANMAGFYGVYHGPKGLKQIAGRTNKLAQVASDVLESTGYSLITNKSEIFDTVSISCKDSGVSIEELDQAFIAQGINIRKVDSDIVSFSFDETKNYQDLKQLLEIFGQVKGKSTESGLSAAITASDSHISTELARTSDFLTQEIFNSIHSESQMLRYLYYLVEKDISLAKSMIALGSCTMKLNATSEMIPVTWPEFAELHPFVPENQALGYKQMLFELQEQLKAVTGFDAISLQPNSGAQGEYAGLMTIKNYYDSIGQSQRNVCLIPTSAHGTNPASAVIAGLKVVVVKCDERGNVDVQDLKEKAKANKDTLNCVMITYPSTHGVFEESVKEICEIIHQYGGQVYMDGANMNAQVGLTSPGSIGADVCHLNLHKTFCIPHGGGGPGMGPIGVKSHLAPYLPGHITDLPSSGKNLGPVSAAPFGSAAILPISFVYISCMGKKGLIQATETAIMNSNYMVKKLEKDYKILYLGNNGRCGHEFIVDLRSFKTTAGVTEEDVAKRLMDFGFHAPTMSFPVVGTLMIEPTESEDKAELDRFCDALLQIRQEIRDIEEGRGDKKNNLLKNAPHTLAQVTSSEWKHPYSREEAAFPLPYIAKRGKFWPSVGRIDNVFGDRNLICTCPPINEFI